MNTISKKIYSAFYKYCNQYRPIVIIDYVEDSMSQKFLTISSGDYTQAFPTISKAIGVFGLHPSMIKSPGNNIPKNIQSL